MELRQLEAFVEAARRGSISAAARALYVTQPSLTQRIQALERELNETLLYRSRRGVVVTAAGQRLLPFADAAMRQVHRGLEALRAGHALEEGRLSVGASADVAAVVLSEALAAFRARFPALVLDVQVGEPLIVAAAVVAERAELAVLDQPPALEDVDSERLADLPLVAVVAKGAALAGRATVTVEEVAAAGVLLPEQSNPLSQLTVNVLGGASAPARVLARAGSVDALRRLALAGVGVALLPEPVVREDVAVGRLVALPLSGLPRLALWVIRREGAPYSAAAHALLTLLGPAADGGALPARPVRPTPPPPTVQPPAPPAL